MPVDFVTFLVGFVCFMIGTSVGHETAKRRIKRPNDEEIIETLVRNRVERRLDYLTHDEVRDEVKTFAEKIVGGSRQHG